MVSSLHELANTYVNPALRTLYDQWFVVMALSLLTIYLVRASRSEEQRGYHLIGAAGFGLLALGAFSEGLLAISAFAGSAAVLGAVLLIRETNRPKEDNG